MNANENYIADIINRYVYAVTKKLPGSQRQDIQKELRGLIDDMLSQRCGELEQTPKDIDAVLIELGSPDILAEKYYDHKNYLIGPEYYATYLLILKIVLSCTAFGLAIANIMLLFLTPQANIFIQLAGCLGTIFMALVQAFAFITIGFAAAEHYKNKNAKKMAEDIWYPNRLPPLTPVQKEIKKAEPIAGIVFSVLVIILFNFAPQLMGVFTFNPTFKVIPVFDLTYLKTVMPLFNICFALGIAREIFKIVIGKYTVKLSIVTALLNIVAVVISIVIFQSGLLWNANMVSALYETGISPADLNVTEFWRLFTNNFLLVFIFAFILDTATIIVKSIKAQRYNND